MSEGNKPQKQNQIRSDSGQTEAVDREQFGVMLRQRSREVQESRVVPKIDMCWAVRQVKRVTVWGT